MIEVVFGLVLAVIAAALGLGFVPPGFPIQGFLQPLSFAAGLAAMLMILHGLYRHVRNGRSGDTAWLRTVALMVVVLSVLSALLVSTLGKISAASWNGWPVGYLLVAHGATLAMLAVSIVFQRKQATIDGGKANPVHAREA
jgi:putative solute:sodium symporter small subunit